MGQAAKLEGVLGLGCPQPEVALGCCGGQTLSRWNLGSWGVLEGSRSVHILWGRALWKICPGVARVEGIGLVDPHSFSALHLQIRGL